MAKVNLTDSRLWIGLGIGTLTAVCAGVMVPNLTRLPSPMGDRLDGGDIVGIDAGGAYAWVIPSANGVILVDTGSDVDAEALKAEIGDREVLGIFLTHGHFDHTAGLKHFPNAKVHAGPGEVPLILGSAQAGGWMARIANLAQGHDPFMPPLLHEFHDGEEFTVDGEHFTARHVPGHTKGGAVYLWRDVVFTGDTVVGAGGALDIMPPGSCDDPDRIPEAMAVLVGVPAARLADGHNGLHANAEQMIEAFSGSFVEQPDPEPAEEEEAREGGDDGGGGDEEAHDDEAVEAGGGEEPAEELGGF